MINWFNKPYYLISSKKINLLTSFLIGTFIFLFLIVFKPFGISAVKNNLITYSFGFGIITFLILSFMFIIVSKIFKKESWTVGKNILFLIISVTIISIFNWFYNTITQEVKEGDLLLTFSQIIYYTFFISIFPILFLTYITEKVEREKRETTSKEIMKFKIPKIVIKKEIEITLYGTNKEENISFKLKDLIYISSQGNYVTIFLNSNTGIKEYILRNTLRNIINELKQYNYIIRCHKSYIINVNYMNSISGNARGYFLKPLNINKQIPVSRKFTKEELKNLIK